MPPRYTLYPVAPEEEFHDRDTELDVVPVTARPPGTGGTVTVPEPVVPVTEEDLPDSPAEFVAVTWYVYAVEAVRPLSVYVVPVALPTFVPPR